MKKLLILLLFFGFLIAPSIKAETVFYCNSELETGFAKINGSWETSTFKPIRLTIKFNDNYSKLSGINKFETFSCSVPYSFALNYLVCSGTTAEIFLFNKLQKRFVYSFVKLYAGYDRDHPTPDNDVLYAGTCEIF